MSPSASDCCRSTTTGDASWPNVPGRPGSLPEVMGGGTATLRALIREYLFISLFRACAESLASENASRLAAMERADKNIDELLEDLHGDIPPFASEWLEQSARARADATGYKGFYYHFLDMQTGRRVWECELSTVDSAFLLAGA